MLVFLPLEQPSLHQKVVVFYRQLLHGIRPGKRRRSAIVFTERLRLKFAYLKGDCNSYFLFIQHLHPHDILRADGNLSCIKYITGIPS
jgi:hypothetical protein